MIAISAAPAANYDSISGKSEQYMYPWRPEYFFYVTSMRSMQSKLCEYFMFLRLCSCLYMNLGQRSLIRSSSCNWSYSLANGTRKGGFSTVWNNVYCFEMAG